MRLLHCAVFGHSLSYTRPSRAIGASAPCAVRCASQPHTGPMQAAPQPTGGRQPQQTAQTAPLAPNAWVAGAAAQRAGSHSKTDRPQHSGQATTQQHRQQTGFGKERAFGERSNRPIFLYWDKKNYTQWEALRLELQTRTERQWLAEYRFDAVRKWRLDLACPRPKIGIEIDGGVWLPGSGHTKPQRIIKNMEKRNALEMSSWRVLVYTPEQAKDSEKIINEIQTLLYDKLLKI